MARALVSLLVVAATCAPARAQTGVSGEGLDALGRALFWLGVQAPLSATEDDHANSGFFPGFPHAPFRDGYLHVEPLSDREWDAVSWWAVRLSAEGGTDFGRTGRVGGSFFLETTPRVGFSVRSNVYQRRSGGRQEDLYLNTADLTYRFAQNEVFEFYTGLGVNLSYLPQRNLDGNVNWTYGIDAYPIKPLIVSGVIDVGAVEGEMDFHTRGSVGANFRHVECFLGYDYRRLQYRKLDLHGPLLGLRLWF
jgi:hypothetical protein